MRSRYSAFAKRNPGYLEHSWHPVTRPVTVRLDPTLCDGRPGGKVTPYRCDPRA